MKSLWVAGFNLNPDPQSSTFYDPYLAEAPLGYNEVNAVCVDANDLAMPLSICWTGALPAQELCGGADLTGNGSVNILDFAKLASYWRSTNCFAFNNCNGADLEPMETPDGDVDLKDLDVMAEYWLDTGCQ
jgi:hypothetical protein